MAARRSPGFGLCGDRYTYRGNAGGADWTILTGLVSAAGGARLAGTDGTGGGPAFGGGDGAGFTASPESGGNGVTPFSSYFFRGGEEWNQWTGLSWCQMPGFSTGAGPAGAYTGGAVEADSLARRGHNRRLRLDFHNLGRRLRV